MVACQLPKLDARVRFPLYAPGIRQILYRGFSTGHVAPAWKGLYCLFVAGYSYSGFQQKKITGFDHMNNWHLGAYGGTSYKMFDIRLGAQQICA